MSSIIFTITSVTCVNCQIPVFMTTEQAAELRRNGHNFHCLNGHSMHFPKGESADQKRIKELEAKLVTETRAKEYAERNEAKARHALTEKYRTCQRCARVFNTIAAMRSHVTRVHKQVKRLGESAGPDAYGTNITRAHD